MCEINSLLKECGTNYQAVTHLLYQETANITSVPAPVTNYTGTGTNPNTYHTIVDDIVLSGSNVWKRIELSKNTGKLVSTPKGNVDAESIDTQITGFYPEITAYANAVAKDTHGMQGVFIACYVDGKQRVVGTLTNPAEIKMVEDTQKGGYDITVMHEGTERPPYYTGAAAE